MAAFCCVDGRSVCGLLDLPVVFVCFLQLGSARVFFSAGRVWCGQIRSCEQAPSPAPISGGEIANFLLHLPAYQASRRRQARLRLRLCRVHAPQRYSLYYGCLEKYHRVCCLNYCKCSTQCDADAYNNSSFRYATLRVMTT